MSDHMHHVPVYTADELDQRIVDGSLDLNRLAATVYAQQATIAAMANWINQQIQPQMQVQESATEPAQPVVRARKG